MKHFDLDAELAVDPPKKHHPKSILHHPRIAEWLGKLLEMRAAGAHVTNGYIAEKLTKGAQLEGIIGPDEQISEGLVQWHYRGKRGRTQVQR